MANDIDSVSKSNGTPKVSDVTASRRTDAEKSPRAEAKAADSRGNDTVALTDSARLLQATEAKLAQAADVDPVRIEAIKSAIASGDYQIDDRVVAEKIIRSDRERG